MQKTITTVLLLFHLAAHAQQNCSNPFPANLCSGMILSQTTAGMIDDFPSTCNIVGEDVLYKVSAPATTQKVIVWVVNASRSFKLSLQTACGGSCATKTGYAGSSSYTFIVSPASHYYIWVDAATTLTYDIGFYGDTGSAFVNIPNTQGNWLFASGCTAQPFLFNKPFYEVSYKGVTQVHPMTLAPLNQIGRMCITFYMKNTTGVEALANVQFKYSPLGFSYFVPVLSTMSGFYNTGQWQVSYGTYNLNYAFANSPYTASGDFTGTPNTCLAYTFCFDVVPISNDPIRTEIIITVTSDGKGAGFTGTIRLGCCSPYNYNCLGTGSGTTNGGPHTMAFGINDPPLPVELLSFSAEPGNREVKLLWSTATETDNDYFTLKKSRDAQSWEMVDKIPGSGNSSFPVSYSYVDKSPLYGMSYYRLEQTDFDGTARVAGTCATNLSHSGVKIYPNPARFDLYVESENPDPPLIQMTNSAGMAVKIPRSHRDHVSQLDLSNLKPGIYFLLVSENGMEYRQRVAVAQ